MREIDRSALSAPFSHLLCRRGTQQQKTPVFSTGVLLWIAAAADISSGFALCLSTLTGRLRAPPGAYLRHSLA